MARVGLGMGKERVVAVGSEWCSVCAAGRHVVMGGERGGGGVVTGVVPTHPSHAIPRTSAQCPV